MPLGQQHGGENVDWNDLVNVQTMNITYMLL